MVATELEDIAREVTNPEENELFRGYPDLLTPAHIAEMTGFTVQYVRRLCREQKLPAVRIGAREWFVPKPRFIDYVMGGADA